MARIIIVEGVIGAGKTVLLSLLAEGFAARGKNVCVIPEPVEVWRDSGALERFYRDPARYAYEFQTFVFSTRVRAIREAVRANPSADVYLLERSPATDRIFMALQAIDEVEQRMYELSCGTWEALLPIDLTQAIVLYLKPSIEVCMGRLMRRARAGEVTASGATLVAQTYQEQLQDAHDAYYWGTDRKRFPRLPPCMFSVVHVVGRHVADLNFRELGAERTAVIDYIFEEIGSDLAF